MKRNNCPQFHNIDPTVAGSINKSYDSVEKLNELLEPFGFEYYAPQDIVVSRENGWQKDFGYCFAYDAAAPLFKMIIDCEPVRFSYNGRSWLIELWKGQYGMSTGAEVGIYSVNKPSVEVPRLQLYRAVDAEDYILMKMVLRKNGQHLFSRKARHWWLTGFVPGEYSKPEALVMEVSLFFFDRGMQAAFTDALFEMGYTQNDVIVWGNVVKINYTAPHSKQPLSRKSIFNYFRSRSNRRYCKLYRKVTKDCGSLPDCIEMLRVRKPRAFRYLMGNMRGRRSYKTANKAKQDYMSN